MATPLETFLGLGPRSLDAPGQLERMSLDDLLQQVMREGSNVIRDDPSSPVPTPDRSPFPGMTVAGTPEAEVIPSRPPVGQPYTPGSDMPPRQPNAAPAAAPAATAAPDRGPMTQIAAFLSGLGRGGGAVLPALGGGMQAVEGGNATARALADRGVPTNMIEAAMANPAIMQQVLASTFAPRTATLAPGARLVGTDGRTIADNQPRDQVVPAGASLVQGGREVYRAPERPRPFTDTAIDRLTTRGSALSTARSAAEGFRDTYTIPGVAGVGGTVRNWLVDSSPESWTDPNDRAAAQWWRGYKRNSELTERHELFGAALTATEQAQWKAADIHPNMNATAIRENLRVRNELLTGAMRRYASGLVAAGYDPAPIEQAFGIPLAELGVTATGRGDRLTPGAGGGTGGGGGRVRTYNPATGRLE